VQLLWSRPENDGGSPITGYIVLRGEPGKVPIEVGPIGLVLDYVDDQVINGHVYVYEVAAVNLIGRGQSSANATARPLGAPNAPLGPSSSVDGTSVLLSWQEPGGVDRAPVKGYILYRGTSPDDLKRVAEVGIVREYRDTGLERGTTYYYRIVANSTMGEGTPSDLLKAKIGREKGTPGPGSEAAAISIASAAFLAALLGSGAKGRHGREWSRRKR
jgi:hypothetical protein